MPHLCAVPLVISMLVPSTSEAHIVVAEASARHAPEIGWHSIGALMEAPELTLGEAVFVLAQFHGEVETWDPLLTRFDPALFRCLRFWGDEQWLWMKDEFDAPAGHFFVRLGSSVDGVLSAARPHDRIALELVVREMLGGAAWIEITDAAWTAEQTPEGTVLHAIRAMDLLAREGWALAVSEIDRALAPNLPGHVRRELETLRAVAQGALAARGAKRAEPRPKGRRPAGQTPRARRSRGGN